MHNIKQWGAWKITELFSPNMHRTYNVELRLSNNNAKVIPQIEVLIRVIAAVSCSYLCTKWHREEKRISSCGILFWYFELVLQREFCLGYLDFDGPSSSWQGKIRQKAILPGIKCFSQLLTVFGGNGGGMNAKSSFQIIIIGYKSIFCRIWNGNTFSSCRPLPLISITLFVPSKYFGSFSLAFLFRIRPYIQMMVTRLVSIYN